MRAARHSPRRNALPPQSGTSPCLSPIAHFTPLPSPTSVLSLSYLHPSVASFKRIFLFHSRAESGNTGRSILCLFFVDDKDQTFAEPDLPMRCDDEGRLIFPAARAAVWFSNPFKQKEARPPMKRLLKELLEAESGIGAMPLEFSVEFTRTPDESFIRCSEALRSYALERHGATVVLAQTPWPAGSSALRRKCPALTDFAVVPVPAHRADARYPSLQWTLACAATALTRYAQAPHRLRERLQCAR